FSANSIRCSIGPLVFQGMAEAYTLAMPSLSVTDVLNLTRYLCPEPAPTEKAGIMCQHENDDD
ncbi:MAG: hypothetical protein NTY01_05395, partial [Verrucomicrobia bacterium]|nr:hypothetical protein [Verrucomicrobiota bacterium]